MAKLVANVYADAIFDLAKEEQKIDALAEEVKVLKEALAANPELTRLMNHPKISREEKKELIEAICAERVSGELTGLLLMIVEKGHYNETDAVFECFLEKVREYKNIGSVCVTAAFPLTDRQKEAIENRLLATTAYETIEVSYQTDTALLGGLVIRIKDRVADGSIRTRLQDLTRELTQIQLKEGERTP